MDILTGVALVWLGLGFMAGWLWLTAKLIGLIP